MPHNRAHALISKRIFPLWMREKHASRQCARNGKGKISALVIALAISFGGAAIPWQRAHAQAVANCGGPQTLASLYACYNTGAGSAVGATTSLSSSVANISTSVGNVSTSLGNVSTSLGTVSTSVVSTITRLTNVSTSVGNVSTSLGNVSTSLGGVSTSLGNV